MRGQRNPRVLFLASEASPLVKVGGLADVVGALPKALRRHSVDVSVWLPYYAAIKEQHLPVTDGGRLSVPWAGTTQSVTLWNTKLPGNDVPVILFDHPFLNEGDVYLTKTAGPVDVITRFAFFSQAARAALDARIATPDLLHLHDWHVGLLSVFERTGGTAKRIPTLLTIHNLALQGEADVSLLASVGIEANASPELAADVGSGRLNLLRLGILHADRLNTVSPTYSREILTPAYGEGLDGVIRSRERELTGILNGIDVAMFDPSTDQTIPERYSASDLDGKEACKAALQERCGFPLKPDALLLGFVGRLTNQKGVELVAAALPALKALNAQLVILGTGEHEYEQLLGRAGRDEQERVFVSIGFDAALAQLIYAGCDAFLMPSRFEPCGLGQMIAMRYGTVPIVRATGGLVDTVRDADDDPANGSGFSFGPYTADALVEAVQRCHRRFADRSSEWYTLRQRIMTLDFSWDRSSREYLALYRELLNDSDNTPV